MDNNDDSTQVQKSWLKYISLALRMILRLYSIFIFACDLVSFLFNSYIAILLSLWHLVFPQSTKKISGEVVLIIGSSRGIGKELALQLAAKGSLILCLDITSVENEAVVQQILDNGGRAVSYQCDVTDKDQLARALELIENDEHEITMLYHCCSIPSPRCLTQEQPNAKTMDVTNSYFYLLPKILSKMKKNRKGHIILLTSVAGTNGFSGFLPLNVAQFTVQGLFESIVEELAKSRLDEIKTTLVHVYPFIISKNLENDIRLRVNGLFGSIRADVAAKKILDGVRKNQSEISIPSWALLFGRCLKILPRKVVFQLRELLDTGVDFA